MSEYKIKFAKIMSDTSLLLAKECLNTTEEAERVVLYMSLVSCEVALKSALENAGMAVKKIKAKNHNLYELLNEVSKCTVIRKITKTNSARVNASCIRAIVVDEKYRNATVGNLLDDKKYEYSKFPNEIRYGKNLKHFPANLMANLSKSIIKWVELHSGDIEYKK